MEMECPSIFLFIKIFNSVTFKVTLYYSTRGIVRIVICKPKFAITIMHITSMLRNNCHTCTQNC